MKLRLTSIILLLATVLGLFGCAIAPSESDAKELREENDALLSGSALLNTSASEEGTQKSDFINVAATGDDGKPLFQIVYEIGAGLRVEEQCEALSADIYDQTGVYVPVVHSSMPQKTYELTIGAVKRFETLDVIDSFDLDDTDFVIRVVGTRILIYAESDAALMSGVLFFMEQAAKKDPLDGLYGIDADYTFLYHPNDVPTVTLLHGTNDRLLEFSLETGPQMFVYVRLSYTGNSSWRMQTKYRETDTYRNTGASQLLAYSLGEYVLDTEDERFYTEDIVTSRVGDIYTATAPDSSRVELNLATFRMDFFTPSGKLASSVTNITHNAGVALIEGVLEPNEALFGTGERFNTANQRGKKIEMFTKDIWSRSDACYMVIPMLCSSRGSGIFLNNYEHMMLDLDSASPSNHTKEGTWTATITGAPLDCYIFTTEKIAESIHNYSRLSGYAEMPEEWTYGMIVCAYNPDLTQKWSASITPNAEDGRGEGVYEMIANMETYDLPWTGVLAEAWSPFTIKKQADLKELCDYVHSLGKKFIVYIRVGEAGILLSGNSYDYLLNQTKADGTKNYKLPDTTADTNNPDVGETSAHYYLDISNPAALEWYFDEHWDYLVNEIGVDGCKIDFCETLPENYKLNYYDENVPTAGSHHWYPTAFCAKFYDMISKKPDGGMCYTRGGGIGSQRAPYMWAGDQVRIWASLQYQLVAVLSSGLSGVPYMSYDMGGYKYGYGLDSISREIECESQVFLRGTLFTAYTVCIQTHGTVLRSYQFAEYTDENGNHPYEYVTDVYRAYTKLHEHLTPYITELCEEASTTGMPVMRHPVLGWQDDVNVYNINDEYTFGDAFLIAPILDDGTERSIYLPEGIWEDLNTGDVYEVGAEGLRINVTANLAQLPTFFNTETESDTARELVDGIRELYAYAATLLP